VFVVGFNLGNPSYKAAIKMAEIDLSGKSRGAVDPAFPGSLLCTSSDLWEAVQHGQDLSNRIRPR
jgi:hypothetical protein